MTAMGWLFLISSTALVWGLTGYCFYRVLTLPPEAEAETAEKMKDFHSA
jgi:hypothetical protein